MRRLTKIYLSIKLKVWIFVQAFFLEKRFGIRKRLLKAKGPELPGLFAYHIFG